MSNTRVTFYRGTHGMGIVIAVQYENDRIIFDFGAPFTPLAEIYDGYVKHRMEHRVTDTVMLGRIPEVPYVFAKKELFDYPLAAYEDRNLNTAVFICHLHLDHMSEMDIVHPDIPVYIHEEGLKLLEALDHIEGKTECRPYSALRYHEPVHVGKITLTPYFSDHPCPGSCSFLIETPDSRICYSGDIRYHGTNAEKAYQEVEAMKEKPIDLLIIDSTTTSPSEFEMDEALKEQYLKPGKDYLAGSISENDIYEQTKDALRNFKGLGVVNSYPRDTNMLYQLYQLGNSINRTSVFEPSYAYILYHMSGIKAPVYYPSNQVKCPVEEECRTLFEEVTLKEIKDHPERYVLQNSYANILSLTDLDGIQGKYFHLMGEPLVETEKHYQILKNVIAKLRWEFKSYINLYSFSHAYPNHLAYVIQRLDPKSVVAVHSKHPENLNPVNARQFFPEEGVTYVLKNGELC